MKTVMKMSALFLVLASNGFAFEMNANPFDVMQCKAGQDLVCIQRACPHGSIGCNENPPAPNCFCVKLKNSRP
jgi:hypothetical protein